MIYQNIEIPKKYGTHCMNNIITVQNLKFTYPKAEHETIHGIDFAIQKGEIFGFLGPSGAGKSTTQKILIGLLRKYTGSVVIANQEVRDKNRDFYEKIGVAFEFPNFYSKLTGLENLDFFNSLYKKPHKDIPSLFKMVNLEDAMHERVNNYSKGMKMRLNFIRSLLHDPDILFFDEITSGLDPVNARLMKDIILKKKSEGKTIIITTHNMHDADELCDRVAFIVDGKIPLIDSPRAMKLSAGEKKVRVEYRNSGVLHSQDFLIDAIGTNQVFIQLLQTGQLETIHSMEATLEDVFIKATGRGLV